MNLFKRILSFFTKKEKVNIEEPIPDKDVKFGLSFLPGKEIKSIPIEVPKIGEFYKIDPQVGYFEILSINPTNKKVRIREVCTDNELEITIRSFNYLLMKVEKYSMTELLTASKQRK